MPLEVEAGGVRYRTRNLCAAEQWVLLRRLQPMLPAFYGLEAGLAAPGLALDDVLSSAASFLAVSDEVSSEAFSACMDSVERQDGDDWVAADQDAPLATLTAVLRIVVIENFTALFALKRPGYWPIPVDGPSYTAVGMPDGEEWLWRPVLRGLAKAESLYDGTLRIEHIAKANIALDVADENEARARKAIEAAAKRR